MKRVLVLLLLLLGWVRPAAQAPTWAITYYVDSSLGNDANSCLQAQNPTTPKKSVNGAMTCNPSAGQTVKFRGEFKDTLYPNRSGIVLYAAQDIARVDGSTVTFNIQIASLNPGTDYVTVYGSRKGNSGAFAVMSVSGNQVTVNTNSLPKGKFQNELASDPGQLQAAILRPVRFTAWDQNNLPVFNGCYQAYHAINQSVILYDHWRSIAGGTLTCNVWPVVEIDGTGGGNSDYHIISDLDISNAEAGIFTESRDFHSNYDIVQFNTLHDMGLNGSVNDDVFIYWGQYGTPNLHHDYAQIVNNRVGPHKADASTGDGIDLKTSAHFATISGNEIFGIRADGCSNTTMKIDGPDAYISNNYIHDILAGSAYGGCGIAVQDDKPADPTFGGDRAIIENNRIVNVPQVGIGVFGASGVQIIDNSISNIPPRSGCDAACMEENGGIWLTNWQGPLTDIQITGNTVQKAHIGIGRYIWAHNEFAISISSDYNIVGQADYPFRNITPGPHDVVGVPTPTPTATFTSTPTPKPTSTPTPTRTPECQFTKPFSNGTIIQVCLP